MNDFFKRYIKNPFMRLYHTIFGNYYVYDNPTNQERIDYLKKVIANPEYQPSTPVEHYTEKHVMDIWIAQDPSLRDEFWWQVIRPIYFQRIIDYVDQFPKRKDD